MVVLNFGYETYIFRTFNKLLKKTDKAGKLPTLNDCKYSGTRL
jgi:hypothetical protein